MSFWNYTLVLANVELLCTTISVILSLKICTYKNKSQRLEKDNLRQNNVDLMDRLKQLWASFKQSSPSIANQPPSSAQCRGHWQSKVHQQFSISSAVYSTTSHDDGDDDESNVDDEPNRTNSTSAKKVNPARNY